VGPKIVVVSSGFHLMNTSIGWDNISLLFVFFQVGYWTPIGGLNYTGPFETITHVLFVIYIFIYIKETSYRDIGFTSYTIHRFK
jgi:hypothetical protein